MENHDSDRILLIDDDPMVRLLAELNREMDPSGSARTAGQGVGFASEAPSFADIFDPRVRRLLPQQGQTEA